MTHYSTEPRTRKYVKGYEFLSFARNLTDKYRKQLLNTELDSLKITPENVVHKTGDFLGNKISDTVAKSYDDKIVNAKLSE